MSRQPILEAGVSYRFSKYFELPYAPADILLELGCTYVRSQLQLPKYEGTFDCIDFLKGYLPRNLNYVNPISFSARREVLIAPTLLELCAEIQSELNIEYPVNVNNFLKGSLDYFISSPNALIVIEAKQSDLSRGFTQLAVELIAVTSYQLPVTSYQLPVTSYQLPVTSYQLPLYLIKFKPKNKAATVPATQISPLTIFCKTESIGINITSISSVISNFVFPVFTIFSAKYKCN